MPPRYHRAKEAEEARLEKEANDRRREQERQRRLLDKVTKFMMDKADQYAKLSKLEDLAAFLGIGGANTGTEEHSELQRAMEFVLVNLRNQLSPSSIKPGNRRSAGDEYRILVVSGGGLHLFFRPDVTKPQCHLATR